MSENRIPYASLFCFLERAAEKFDFVLDLYYKLTTENHFPIVQNGCTHLLNASDTRIARMVASSSKKLSLALLAYHHVAKGVFAFCNFLVCIPARVSPRLV